MIPISRNRHSNQARDGLLGRRSSRFRSILCKLRRDNYDAAHRQLKWPTGPSSSSSDSISISLSVGNSFLSDNFNCRFFNCWRFFWIACEVIVGGRDASDNYLDFTLDDGGYLEVGSSSLVALRMAKRLRKLSPFISMMVAWWTSLSTAAAVMAASGKTSFQAEKG